MVTEKHKAIMKIYLNTAKMLKINKTNIKKMQKIKKFHQHNERKTIREKFQRAKLLKKIN